MNWLGFTCSHACTRDLHHLVTLIFISFLLLLLFGLNLRVARCRFFANRSKTLGLNLSFNDFFLLCDRSFCDNLFCRLLCNILSLCLCFCRSLRLYCSLRTCFIQRLQADTILFRKYSSSLIICTQSFSRSCRRSINTRLRNRTLHKASIKSRGFLDTLLMSSRTRMTFCNSRPVCFFDSVHFTSLYSAKAILKHKRPKINSVLKFLLLNEHEIYKHKHF